MEGQWYAAKEIEHQVAVRTFKTYEVAYFNTTVLGLPLFMNQQSLMVATKQ